MEKAKDLIDVLDAGFDIWETWEAAYEDKKIDWKDSFLIMKPMRSVGEAFEGKENIFPSLRKYPIEVKNAAVAHVKMRFDIENDIAEILIEDVLAWLFNTWMLGDRVAKFVKKKAA